MNETLHAPYLVTVAALLQAALYVYDPERGDDFFSPNIYQTLIKDDRMLVGFPGNITLDHMASEMKVFTFAVHCMWLLGRQSFRSWQLQGRSVQEMCGLLLRSKGGVFFQLKMEKL